MDSSKPPWFLALLLALCLHSEHFFFNYLCTFSPFFSVPSHFPLTPCHLFTSFTSPLYARCTFQSCSFYAWYVNQHFVASTLSRLMCPSTYRRINCCSLSYQIHGRWAAQSAETVGKKRILNDPLRSFFTRSCFFTWLFCVCASSFFLIVLVRATLPRLASFQSLERFFFLLLFVFFFFVRFLCLSVYSVFRRLTLF